MSRVSASASTRPPHAQFAVTALAAVALPTAAWLVFEHAPLEAQMGIAQKIFYFHVPSAYAMYLGWGVSGIASAVWLFSRKRPEAADALAVAGAEVGLLFCAIVLCTGPLWARKAWGVYWTWDPRLTSTLLGGLMFLAFVVLRGLGTGEGERKFAAALALLGIPNAVLIHYSVNRWRGQHPQVITGRGGGLAADMLPAFFVALGAFTLLAVALLWTRARAERARQRVQRLRLDAAERGLLDDA